MSRRLLLDTIFDSGLLAGIGLWLYHSLNKKRANLELAPAPFVDTRPLEVIAYSELDRIEALNLPARNQIKEHYSLVDVCLRRYIEGRYEIPALEQTSAELRSAFRRSPAPAEDAAEFMDIFSESDLLKLPVVLTLRCQGLVNGAHRCGYDNTKVKWSLNHCSGPEVIR